jgi:hypothetical protein
MRPRLRLGVKPLTLPLILTLSLPQLPNLRLHLSLSQRLHLGDVRGNQPHGRNLFVRLHLAAPHCHNFVVGMRLCLHRCLCLVQTLGLSLQLLL